MIGISLRFLSLKTNEDMFVAARYFYNIFIKEFINFKIIRGKIFLNFFNRIVLCIDLLIWYLRLLHVSIVFKSLGPKLVMIQKMVIELKSNLFIYS
jgi:hypothetical protein